MFIPSSATTALLVALFSMCCWGSWSNSVVIAGDRVRFELFYLDFSVGLFLFAIVAALTLGMISSSGKGGDHTFLRDFSNGSTVCFLFSFVAGLLFNVSNLLLCKGIAMLGLALAFPLCIGTGLVLGTSLTYAIQPKGNALLLFLGVFAGFVAVCSAAVAHRLKERTTEARETLNQPEPCVQGRDGPSLTRKLVVCITGGVIMSLWNPLVTLATDGDQGISAYTNMLLFNLATLLSSLGLCPLLIAYPIEGCQGDAVRPAVGEYCKVPAVVHAYGYAGGAVWCAGTLANAIAGSSGILSSAESYAIGQCANMVAIFWGVFFFKEFAGTGLDVKGCLVVVCLLYCVAICLIALSSN